MSDGGAWRGNWWVRMYERIRERGFTSLTSFAEAHPAVPLTVLADKLGDDVAAIQLLRGLHAEAERRRQVTRFVRDVLVRQLAANLPDGWPAVLDDSSRFTIAKALAFWSVDTPPTHEARVERARAALRANPPPPGWRPLGPDDALLLTLLPDEEA